MTGDWGWLGTLPAWFTVIMTLGAVAVAHAGLETWKKQLRAKSTHEVAMEIATAAGNLHMEFFNQRAPLIEPHELPPAMGDISDQAADMQHALTARYRKVEARGLELFNFRGKAQAILGKESAEAVEKLARQTYALKTAFNRYARSLNFTHPSYASERDDAERLAFSPFGEERTDEISVNFERAFQDLLSKLRPYLYVE